MTEQIPSAIGTVAQEAARLIEDMATMARSSHNRPVDPAVNEGDPEGRILPDPPYPAGDSEAGSQVTDDPGATSEGACSMCGAERDHFTDDSRQGTSGSEIPSACRLCPLCRGVSLLRSVRPETVDLLADLALSVAAALRDVATRTRASDPASSARPASGPAGRDRPKVLDIPVDDESEA